MSWWAGIVELCRQVNSYITAVCAIIRNFAVKVGDWSRWIWEGVGKIPLLITSFLASSMAVYALVVRKCNAWIASLNEAYQGVMAGLESNPAGDPSNFFADNGLAVAHLFLLNDVIAVGAAILAIWGASLVVRGLVYVLRLAAEIII